MCFWPVAGFRLLLAGTGFPDLIGNIHSIKDVELRSITKIEQLYA